MANILSDTKCKNSKPQAKKYRIYDTGGLYLEVMPNGSKYWRVKYRYLNKEKLLALGVYPTITLQEAREGRDRARKLLAVGSDPSTSKKEEKRLAILNSENTFEAVAREWHANQKDKWSEVHARNVLNLLSLNIFSHLGNRPIADITAPELLAVLRKIEKRGAVYLANRIKEICGQVFRYGIFPDKPLDNLGKLEAPQDAKTQKEKAAFIHSVLMALPKKMRPSTPPSEEALYRRFKSLN